MTILGISLIAIGIALVCAGLVFRPRAPRSDSAALNAPDEFRTILDALDEEDRRDESRDLGEPLAKEQPTDPAAGPRSNKASNVAPVSVNRSHSAAPNIGNRALKTGGRRAP